MSEPNATHREFPVTVALSVASGKLLCDFADFHECVEYVCARPIYTHEMADEFFARRLAAAVYDQAPHLRVIDVGSIDKVNVHRRLAEINRTHPDPIPLKPAPWAMPLEGPLESLSRMMDR